MCVCVPFSVVLHNLLHMKLMTFHTLDDSHDFVVDFIVHYYSYIWQFTCTIFIILLGECNAFLVVCV